MINNDKIEFQNFCKKTKRMKKILGQMHLLYFTKFASTISLVF